MKSHDSNLKENNIVLFGEDGGEKSRKQFKSKKYDHIERCSEKSRQQLKSKKYMINF